MTASSAAPSADSTADSMRAVQPAISASSCAAGGATLAEEIGVELLGQVPLEAAVATGGDVGAPVALDGDGPAAEAFRAIARMIATETVPPVAMAGCSARLLDAVEIALGPTRSPASIATS